MRSETKKIMKNSTQPKPLRSLESVKAVRWVKEDLWWEKFVEKVRFEFGVEDRFVLSPI